MPESRPMPSIGIRCHELRIADRGSEWRLIYRTDSDAVIVADVFKKKTKQTPDNIRDRAKRRFRRYDDASQ